MKQAALFGCAIPTGMGAILREMDLREGSSIAVFGAGGVGQSALVGAKLRKANPVIVVDVDDDKLENAVKNFKATHTINALKEDPVARIKEITDGKGVDFSLESCGQVKVMEQAFKCVRNFGGLCVIAGNAKKGNTMSLDPYDFIFGKRVLGTWGGGSKIDEDIGIYVTLFMRDEISEGVNPLITHDDTLENITRVFEIINSGKAGRVMLSFKKE
jgi:S-(hydroxymethyl)glutathione dehydrogenase/alcohol dehydrogenase